MKKIAITGASTQDRLILSHALHYLTGYDVVRHTPYSSQAIKYHLNSTFQNCNWQELFVYGFSSFSERIEIEQQYDTFISNGSVFNEVAEIESILELTCSGKNKKSKEHFLMLSGIKKIISEYAERTYDCIIHIEDDKDKENQFFLSIDTHLKELGKNIGKKYFIQKDSVLPDLLETITTEMEFSNIISTKTALEKAKRDLFNHH